MSITPGFADDLMARIRSLEAEVDALQSMLAAEPLAGNQRQYLARCFDLLHMELAAVRTYLADLGECRAHDVPKRRD